MFFPMEMTLNGIRIEGKSNLTKAANRPHNLIFRYQIRVSGRCFGDFLWWANRFRYLFGSWRKEIDFFFVHRFVGPVPELEAFDR